MHWFLCNAILVSHAGDRRLKVSKCLISFHSKEWICLCQGNIVSEICITVTIKKHSTATPLVHLAGSEKVEKTGAEGRVLNWGKNNKQIPQLRIRRRGSTATQKVSYHSYIVWLYYTFVVDNSMPRSFRNLKRLSEVRALSVPTSFDCITRLYYTNLYTF